MEQVVGNGLEMKAARMLEGGCTVKVTLFEGNIVKVHLQKPEYYVRKSECGDFAWLLRKGRHMLEPWSESVLV